VSELSASFFNCLILLAFQGTLTVKNVIIYVTICAIFAVFATA